MFSKLDIMVSRGRSLIGRAGVLIAWPSTLVPKFPSRGNFGDDGHVAFGTESGFPKFPQNKIFRWRLCIWQSSPCLALLSKNLFSKNDLPNLDSLVQIKNRDTNRVRTLVARSPRGRVYSFWRLCWGFRELDSNSWYLVLTTLMCFFALHVHWCA